MPDWRLASALLVAGACTPGTLEETGLDTAVDTGQAPIDSWFDEGVLDPPFEHGNATWAGVALLDYDIDGWLDIFLTNGLMHPSALYRNQGDGSFVDVAAEAGVDSLDAHGSAVAGDIDNDGDADLVVGIECSVGTLDEYGAAIGDGRTVLYRNQGDGTFTQESVVLPNPSTVGYCPISLELADMNSDGSLDLVVANGLDLDQVFPWIYRKEVREAVDHVLLNDGTGHFTTQMPINNTPPGSESSADELEFQFVTFTSVLLDINRDSRLDRIAGFGGGPMQVYLQNEQGELDIQLEENSAVVGEGLWMGAAVADYDGDEDVDLYLTNQGLSPLIAGYDNLPKNIGPNGEDETAELQANPLGPLAGTINPFHLLLRHEQGVLREDQEVMLESDGILAGDLFNGMPDSESGEPKYPRWINPPNLARLAWAWGTVSLDVDADGWSDVALNSNNCSAPMDIIWDERRGAGPGALLLNRDGEGFVDVTWEAGVANVDDRGRYQDGRGLATGDLNNDGYPDLVYANRTYNPTQSDPLAQEPGTPKVWLSQARDGQWLQLDLVGTTSNRDGLGASVHLHGFEGSRVHMLGAGGGTNSSSERLVTLGLGDVERVNISVNFPSGATVTLLEVEPNQRIVVEEPVE